MSGITNQADPRFMPRWETEDVEDTLFQVYCSGIYQFNTGKHQPPILK